MSSKMQRIEELIKYLKKEKRIFLNENLIILKRLINKKLKKLRVSPLSLMQYNWHENTHSNILEYLFDYNSFDKAASLLGDFVKYCPNSNDNLVRKILKKTYDVEREYIISNYRIDLLIRDDKEKFVIIIENKIFAEIGKIYDEDGQKITDQLKKYVDACEKKFITYDQHYILLHYNNNEEDVSKFERISYKQLYDLLLKTTSNDNVFDEYLLLLKEDFNPYTNDLSSLKILANKVLKDHCNEDEISLIEYYTLKNYFDEE